MKRSATTILERSVGGGAKRQASLAGFLKPKAKIEVSRVISKVDKGKGKEIIFEEDDFAIIENPAVPLDSKGETKPPSTVLEEQEEDLAEVSIPDTPVPLRRASSSLSPPPPPRPPAIQSYHPPPTPTYNHPITIIPPPPSLHLQYNTKPRVINDQPDPDLLYFTRFIHPSCATALTKYLLEALPWYRVKYVVRGIPINTPRFTTVFGKDSTDTPWNGYGFFKPRAIPEILLRLKKQVEEVTNETYNFALVNYYSSGDDSISYHSDSESFLGPDPCIASISLGAPRDFMLRHTKYKENKLPVQKFSLHDGDMVVMRGSTQHCWEHSIPKRKHADGRINITFRKGIVKYATKNYNQYNVGNGPMYRWEGGKMVEKG